MLLGEGYQNFRFLTAAERIEATLLLRLGFGCRVEKRKEIISILATSKMHKDREITESSITILQRSIIAS